MGFLQNHTHSNTILLMSPQVPLISLSLVILKAQLLIVLIIFTSTLFTIKGDAVKLIQVGMERM